MRIANIMTAVLIAALAILATDAASEEKIYRWVDENGAVHFGDMPPDNVAAELVRVVPDTVSGAPSSAATTGSESAASAEPQPSLGQQLREERAQTRKEREAQQKEVAEACEKAQKLVSELEPSTRVMVKTEDGEVKRLDDNTRLETLDKAKTFIAENCDKKK